MFRIIKNKRVDYELVNKNLEEFLSILKIILQLLNKYGHNSQAKFIQKLIDLINQQNIILFSKFVNGVDMWGGSGAVWEVSIENETEAKAFEDEILKLIGLMEQTEILGKGIKPIRKIFENNQAGRDLLSRPFS
ncbi:MAG TPA: hypothetical protein VFP20_05245 [Bacteroidales bacterium]|nr:hypothetical protein [Bacteroidales bacterium]